MDTAIHVGQRLSLAEFLELDIELIELVEGVPIVTPSPNVGHQRISMRLSVLISASIANVELEVLAAPIDWVLWAGDRPTVRQPDLVVIPAEDAAGPRLTAPPLLVVEILSPSSIERDVVAKRRDYARAGAGHYWIVDPVLAEVVVLRLTDGDYAEVARVQRKPVALTEPFTITLDPTAIFPK